MRDDGYINYFSLCITDIAVVLSHLLTFGSVLSQGKCGSRLHVVSRRVPYSAQFEDEFLARVRVFGHSRLEANFCR